MRQGRAAAASVTYEGAGSFRRNKEKRETKVKGLSFISQRKNSQLWNGWPLWSKISKKNITLSSVGLLRIIFS